MIPDSLPELAAGYGAQVVQRCARCACATRFWSPGLLWRVTPRAQPAFNPGLTEPPPRICGLTGAFRYVLRAAGPENRFSSGRCAAVSAGEQAVGEAADHGAFRFARLSSSLGTVVAGR